MAAAVAAPIAQGQADPPQGQVTIPAWLAKIHYPGNSVPTANPSQGHVAVPAWLARIHHPGNSVVVAPAVSPRIYQHSPGVGTMPARKPVDPLAVSYLTGRGLSPSEVASWTSGVCSHEVRPASCYAMFDTPSIVSTQVSRAIGFQWADAGIGAGFAFGVVLLLGGAIAGFLISRESRGRLAARA